MAYAPEYSVRICPKARPPDGTDAKRRALRVHSLYKGRSVIGGLSTICRYGRKHDIPPARGSSLYRLFLCRKEQGSSVGRTFHAEHVFDAARITEQINRLTAREMITTRGEKRRVTGLRGHVAADVHNPAGRRL